MNTLHEYLSILKQYAPVLISILALITAGIAAYMAWRQAQTAKVQKRAALFEKRFKIYDSIRRTMVGAESTDGNSLIKQSPDPESLAWPAFMDFLRATTDMEFFFEINVCRKVKEIETKLMHLRKIALELEGSLRLQDRKRRDECREEGAKLSSWVREEIPKLGRLFNSYFDFRKP